MNNKANYTLIGFFVLIGFGAIVSFGLWMLQPSSKIELKYYAIEFDESVLGLNVDSDVKYRGINVGKVKSLAINPNNLEQVEVIIEILKSTPIKEDTVAKLTAQGITGLSYINLSMGSKDAKYLIKKEGEKYPVIKTIPSFFEEFENSFGSVSQRLSSLMFKSEKFLNDKNQENIAKILVSTANILSKVDATLDEKTLSNMQQSVQSFNSLAKKVDDITPNVNKLIDKSIDWEHNISQSLGSIMKSYKSISGSLTEVKRAIKSGEFNIKEITSDVVPSMHNTLLDMQDLLIGLDGMIEQYKKSPGDILFKQENSKKGPGEE